MRSALVSAALGFALSASAAHAYPVSLDIGALAIDDYTGNGDGMLDLGYMIAGGQNFFLTANSTVPAYAAGMVSTPTLALDLRNSQVTKAAITNASSQYGSREYCDFVYYGGHGINGKMFLGNSGPYGYVNPADLNLGAGYNRWFLANSCSLFNTADPAATWAPAFKGLKAMLGFRSFVFDNNLSYLLYQDFWLNWTARGKSLVMSFFDAEADYGYKHLYPTKGLEPGCLSAQYTPGVNWDYCRELFHLVGHDYNPAIPNTGLYFSKVIGTPQY